jgi:23S rRNA (cytidine1920-2'-O)/16S rRNA (cytidine1409-2'-O)-methyltransferase
MRIDQLLVSRGLVPSRSAAQRLIDGGAVRWRANDGWYVPHKAGHEVPDDSQLEITDNAELRWVSRGGLKLDGALAQCGVDVRGRICLDVGQGRGGFTDVLLARGAARVVGIEVGHDQLHPRLRDDRRVHAFEGVNARHLTREQLSGAMPAIGFDLITGDLSFISLTLVTPALEPLLANTGELLLLVKPQFELQPAQIGKGGIVKSPAFNAEVEARLRAACATSGLRVQQWLPSPIAGGDGNREFFVRAARAAGRQEQGHV